MWTPPTITAFQAGIVPYTPGMDPFGADFFISKVTRNLLDDYTLDIAPSITMGVEIRDLRREKHNSL